MLLYDAKRDMLVVFCGEQWVSVDRNLREGPLSVKWSEEKGDRVWFESPRDGVQVGLTGEIAHPEEWKRQRGWYDENEDDDEDDDDDEEDENEEDEDEDSEQEIS